MKMIFFMVWRNRRVNKLEINLCFYTPTASKQIFKFSEFFPQMSQFLFVICYFYFNIQIGF